MSHRVDIYFKGFDSFYAQCYCGWRSAVMGSVYEANNARTFHEYDSSLFRTFVRLLKRVYHTCRLTTYQAK